MSAALRPRSGALALVLALVASVAPASARSDSARPAEGEVHRAIVTCERAPFYVWPDRSSAPHTTSYLPARLADSFNVIGDGTLAVNALTLYETTIDVVEPFGAGKHYWISAACVNAG